ncbi:MAG: hypothetical protein HY259_00540 [Chloroflexi bacterium]|nr:hypothetical protein [Chloroflexota bacterium]
MKRPIIYPLAVAALIALIAACGGSPAAKPAATPPDPAFPDFVYSSPSSVEAYRFAARMPALLAVLPCYCNCGPTLGHRSLRDCFFKSDGSFTDHASGCAVCQMEAADAAKGQEQGKSPAQIRRMIETKYDAYGPATDTPAIR